MIQNKPKVTVLIPCFNTERYLPATLQSVMSQTCSADEIVVVDDGSSDGTLDVMNQFAATCDRIKVIALEKNQGVVAARNAGLAQSTGDYVAMLDGDDIWPPYALAHRVELAQRFPQSEVIATDFAWFEEVPDEAKVGHVGLGPRGRLAFAEAFGTGKPMFIAEPFELAATTHFVWVGASLVKRSALTEVGDFDPRFVGPEDTLLWLKLASRGSFVFSPTITAFYRQRPGSIVALLKGPKELHYLKVLHWISERPDFDRYREVIARVAAECHDVAATYYGKNGHAVHALRHAFDAVSLQPGNGRLWRGMASAVLQPLRFRRARSKDAAQ